MEILKHLDGDLEILPLPSIVGERRAEMTGRTKIDSLLSDQEAIRLQVVAGLDLNQRPLGYEPDSARKTGLDRMKATQLAEALFVASSKRTP